MWFVKSWIYKGRYGKLPFKMRNLTESFQEECREAIKNSFGTITAKLPGIWVRIKLKDAKQKMHDQYLDIFGRPVAMKQPPFTQNEIVKYKQNKLAYAGALVLMLLFETFLYSMIKKILLSKDMLQQYPGIEFAVGFFFAAIFVAMLHFAFKYLWAYFEAKTISETEEVDPLKLKPFRRNYQLALIMIVIFIIANLATGYLRATFLEPHSKNGGETVNMIHIAFLLFSILITFGVAIVMALLEKEIGEKSEKIKVFSNWKRQQKERKKYNSQIKTMLKKCLDRMDLLIESYWGLIKDLQRVFETEVDQDREALYAELEAKIANGELDMQQLSEPTYQKYLAVAATRHELFEYGIQMDKGLQETIYDLQAKVADIEAFEQKNATSSDGGILTD
ncbi:hypothetical protein [Mucilaginibacter sp. HD30]